MPTFEDLQVNGMHPSLLTNRIQVPDKNIVLLLEKIRVTETGCWEWMGGRYPNGYGAVKIRALSPNRVLVHRLCYEMVHGPVADGLHIHHKVEDGCMGKICCNPAHLKPVTPKEHTHLTPESVQHKFSLRTACSGGHKYNIKTVYVSPVDGSRQCKTCRNLAAKAFRARQRGDRPMGKGGPKLKEFCKRGHPMSGDNLGFVSRGIVSDRICKACRAERARNAYARNEKKAAPVVD